MSIALAVLCLTRMGNILTSLIPDCDEVFNYYEPLNLLTRGFGKQTWEYSPQYAIRSWAYLLPYALTLKPLAYIVDELPVLPPWIQFFVLRSVLAIFTVYAEYHLYKSLSQVNKSTAHRFLLFSTLATGMSHASVALLPSAFAMNCTMLATSNFLRYLQSHKIFHALLITMWFCLGSLVGWAFTLVLGLPTMLYIIYDQRSPVKFKRYINWSIFIAFLVLVVVMEIDHFFYAKTVVVPFNIVFYNVLNASDESGPNIFGVEDFSYYVKNLLLNFNAIALLSVVSVVTIPLCSQRKLGVTCGVLSPLVLWCVVFGLQPHKEERFLYPIYGLINATAALSFTHLFNCVDSILSFIFKNKTLVKYINYTLITITLSLISILSILRTLSLTFNYNAPLSVYSTIPQNASGNLCTSREWYRFPSSFFLPKGLRLQFVKSGFNGLLPGDFDEDVSLLDSIREIPSNMNNMNLFDESKLIDFNQCDWFVDIDQPVDDELNEISMIGNNKVKDGWKLITSVKFLDNENSKGLGKWVYIPDFLKIQTKTELKYHNYNLYQKIN